MIASLTVTLFAAALIGDEPPAAPTPASPRLTEAVAAVEGGLDGLPGLTVLGYPVEGESPRAIRSSMNDGRPPDESNGARHDARTRWNFRTRWGNGPDGRCDPRTATVDLTLTVILPDLTTRDELSARGKADWDAYFTALVAHERNHGRIAVEGRNRMQAAMRASPTCEAMRALVGATNQEVTAASGEYDQQTDHGRREGAVYPRPDA